MERIIFQGPVDHFGSYSLHLFALARGLKELGFEVGIRPLWRGEKIPEDIQPCLVSGLQAEPFEVLLAPLTGHAPSPGKRTIRLFSWETTRMPASEVALINRCEVAVVPSNFVATVASACGVEIPMVVAPLGVSEAFRFQIMEKGPFTFACAGNLTNGRERKGLHRIVELFQKAFPTERNVRLLVKSFPASEFKLDDPRIEVTQEFLNEQGVAAWLGRCHCFINFATGGWESWAHQAMACGRPVLGCAFGGMADYFNEGNGLVVAHRLVPAGDSWKGLGRWAEPDEDAAIKAMRWAAEHFGKCATLGLRANEAVEGLTWVKNCQRLAAVLEACAARPVRPPVVTRQAQPAIDLSKPFRFIHGLGDCCNAATLFHAVMARTGQQIKICCEPDKADIFQAAGCAIVGQAEQEHPWGHPVYNQLPRTPWSDNKTAFNSPWPMDEKFWGQVCRTYLTVPQHPRSSEWADRMTELRPEDDTKLILLHRSGETSGELKNMSPLMEAELVQRLIGKDRLVVRVGKLNVTTVDDLIALLWRATLLIGIDSGPLHLARMTDTPALGVWFGLHPTAFALPCPRIRHLCFRDHPFTNQYGSSAHYAAAGVEREKEYNLKRVEAVTVNAIVAEAERMLLC